jgi:flavin-dependent dehydrogenase
VKKYDIIIVGGGLAGLTAALHLSRRNYSVLVIEKKRYPHHKVCGEYVSNEVIPYLEQLGVSFEGLQVKQIDTLLLSSSLGKSVQTKLPLGGIGISRFAFDHLLFEKAIEKDVDFQMDTVLRIDYKENNFTITTEQDRQFSTGIVIGAYGKRDSLDKRLHRTFIQNKSSWLGVKAHYKCDGFPDNLVALHNFSGGYGGLSKTETGAVNFCYLTSYKSFQKEKSIAEFNTNVVARNPYLGEFLEKATPVFEEPLTIAQISFQPKTAVHNHILMCGDTAGLIHPLCGNGMAMAIHAAKIASELICEYMESKDRKRSRLEEHYEKLWSEAFTKRLWTGRQLQTVLLNETASSFAINLAIMSPVVLRRLIKNTHGKPISC